MAASAGSGRIGAAFIVSNDYKTHQSGLGALNGTHKDAAKMTAAFNKLNYEVVSRENMTTQQLIAFVVKAASLPYGPSYRRLVFVFAGHGAAGKQLFDEYGRPSGNAGGQIYTQEGGMMGIEELVSQFKPDKNRPQLGKMARLFFFDVCRGTNDDVGVELISRGFASDRGGSFLTPDRVPTYGNILISYSTLPTYKSYEVFSGGLWMGLLAEAIQTQNNDLSVVLTDVSRKLTEICKSSFPYFQTPQCINQLTERVNLLGEFLSQSPQHGPFVHVPANSNSSSYNAVIPPPLPAHVPPAPISVNGGPPPGPPTFHRSQSSPPQKTAISQLQEYCQQNKLQDPDYREMPAQSDGFRFTVTVNGRSYNGEMKARKQDARQSAAEVAMRRVGSITSVHDRGSTATANSVSYVKDLKEKYFDKNHQIQFKKDYFVTHQVVGGYQCTLTIPGIPMLHGETGHSKSDAENNAAKSALKYLQLL